MIMSITCEALIFDLDGVLVDSEDAVEQRWRYWAERRDIPFEEVEAVYHGRPMAEVIREVAPHLDAEAETEEMNDATTAAPDTLQAFDGAEQLLDDLPEARWTIATSGRRRTATNRLSQVGLPIPDTLVTADDIEKGKPAPDPYLLAADRLGVEPAHCVVFEDAPAGVDAAQRAGAHVIGVATATPPDALAPADGVVRSVGDIRVEPTGHGTLRVRWISAADRSE